MLKLFYILGGICTKNVAEKGKPSNHHKTAAHIDTTQTVCQEETVTIIGGFQ